MVATVQMAPENAVPVVELPLSEEYGDSEDIDPAAVASAAARIAEFVSDSEGILGAGSVGAMPEAGAPVATETPVGNRWEAAIVPTSEEVGRP